MRHSGRRRVQVTVGYRPEELELIVDDDGRGVGRAVLGERAPGTDCGGSANAPSCTAGRSTSGRPHGGTRVQALLPVGATR